MQDINTVGRLFMDRRIKPHNLHHHNHNLHHNRNNQQILKCPRCESSNTKFCYYNNYNLSQPRHFCKNCRRYWTRGGVLRNVPVGGGCRKPKPKSKPKPGSPFINTSNNNIKNNTSPDIFQIGDSNLLSGGLIINNLMSNNNNSDTTSFSDLMENQSGGIIGEWSGPNEVNPTARIEDLLENRDWENPTVENGDHQGLFDFTSTVDHHQAYWSQTTSTLNWTPNNSFTNDLPLFLP